MILIWFVASEPICSLTWNDSRPVLETDHLVKDDVVRISCSVVYNGHVIPEIQWETVDELDTPSIIHSANQTRACLDIKIKPAHQGRRFTCTTLFYQKQGITNISTSTPSRVDFNASCTSPALNVLCKFNQQ